LTNNSKGARAVNADSRPTHGRNEHTICAWCKLDFATIIELLDHVDLDHLEARPAAA
jgi:hypothetical protein